MLNVLKTSFLAKTDLGSVLTTLVLADKTDVVRVLSTSVLNQPMLFFFKKN